MELFLQHFAEPWAYQGDLHQYLKHVWCYNSSSYNLSPNLDQVLRQRNTRLCYLPPCSTHLVQPADQFIIAKIKDASNRRWELKKAQLIEAGEWQNNLLGNRGWSGKLKNPGKEYFLHLTADAVWDVNSERDAYDFSYARKSMIRCGVSLDVDGVWRKEQIFPHL
jgi:hypothetical protein